MKKNLFIILIFISNNIWGQNHLLGIQGGINFTNSPIKDSSFGSEMRIGFIGGINYEFKTLKKYRLGMDILHSQQGFIYDISVYDDGRGEVGVSKYKFDFLVIPVKVGYELGNKIKIIPRIGILPAFLLKGEIYSPVFNSDGYVVSYETINFEDHVKKIDFGGTFELGFEKKLSESFIICSLLSYKHSFLNFFKSAGWDSLNMKHKGFSISMGLKYEFKNK